MSHVNVFEEKSDPGDYKDWTVNQTTRLQTDETIVLGTVTFVIEQDYLDLGFSIDTTSKVVALDETNKKIVFWTEIDTGERQRAEFEDEGVIVPINISYETSPQGRRYERTVGIHFKQL